MRACRACVVAAVLAAASLVAASSPGAAARRVPTVTLALGGTFTATGRTGRLAGHARAAVGLVTVRGRWDGGAWRLLTTTRTDRYGRYRFRIRPHRRGVLTLRILPPDHQPRRFVLHVV